MKAQNLLFKTATLLATLIITAQPAASNEAIQSFSQAKKLLETKVYNTHR